MCNQGRKVPNAGLPRIGCRWRKYLCGVGFRDWGLPFTHGKEQPAVAARVSGLLAVTHVFSDRTQSPLLQKGVLLSVIKTFTAR